MSIVRVTAQVVFYADMPDGDGEADDWADGLTWAITRAVEALPTVVPDSVSVPEFDDEAES